MRFISAALVVVIVVAGGALAWAMRFPAIEPISAPPTSYSSDIVQRGEELTAMGACVVCHTAPGGLPFAGGLKFETPFGTIHSTNITPDAITGIGSWSVEAFRRAMDDGVARNGQYLYPVFPYDHFTRVSDDDIEAIYAYIMSLEPVESLAPRNQLSFPFNQRLLMAGWNLLFFENKRFEADPTKSPEWNRGAYIAEGLGHCGACHTPRNQFGALEKGEHFAGAMVDGWHAPALNNASPARVPWTADAYVNYFLDGWDGDHGIAAGPMMPVVNQWANLSEDDAYALAEYLLSFQDQTDAEAKADEARAFAASRNFGSADTPATGPTPSADPALAAGQRIFMQVCANCHRANTETAPLGLLASINGPDPSNFLHVVAEGIVAPEGSAGKSMPAFGASLSDDDLAKLALFVRNQFSQQPAWTNIAERVGQIRQH